MEKKIQHILISLYYKDGLEEIIEVLKDKKYVIYSTGGTETFLKAKGVEVVPVESITGFPSILDGRVKTLHPSVFGGILARRDNPSDAQELMQHHIPYIDLVMVDLYPFEETVQQGATEQEIIEKIDIGGISLIRAAAKNYKDTVIIPSKKFYPQALEILKKSSSSLNERKSLSAEAFNISSNYDSLIYKYIHQKFPTDSFKESIEYSTVLRYGENPHQKGVFYGKLEEIFHQKSGKELSYNNLLDLDAGIKLMRDLDSALSCMIILKHNNACGVAERGSLIQAWEDALKADPISAFGGVIICNQKIDITTAQKMHELFFEILLAPDFEMEALNLLQSKKNRIIIQQKYPLKYTSQYRTILNGVLWQEEDAKVETIKDLVSVTKSSPTKEQMEDLLFANIICKHTKSNTIVLVKDKQLLASGTGQTSRVDALKQAIHKAKTFGFKLRGAVMASDAFFPFPDCVEIAHSEGISSVIQPGGSIKDKDSIDYCNNNGMSMVFTGSRHFKH